MSNGLALDSGSDTLSVTITSESTGLALSLFSDPPRTVPVTNPFTLTGRAVVYVAEQVTAKVSVRDQGVEVATAGGAPLTYDFGGGRISEIEVGTKPISRSELSATYVGPATPVAPSSPVAGQTWLSSSLKHVRVSPVPADRPVIVTGAPTVQEPMLWTDTTKINMLYTVGNGLRLRQCNLTADPLVAANWTLYGSTFVIGGGVAGVAGQVAHASLYEEGDYLYVTGVSAADNTVRLWRALKTDPTTWTLQGTILPASALTALSATAWGNTFLVKDETGYVLFMEYLSSSRWQTGQATCATIGGTYTFVVNKMQTHYGYGGAWTGSGGPFVVKENGEYILWHHGMPAAVDVLPTEGFRATAPSLRADNWTPLDGGKPFVRRVHPYEVDQVADLDVLTMPDGQRYAFWAANDNRSPMAAHILGTRLLPTRLRYDGSKWVSQEQTPDLDQANVPALPWVRKPASDKTVAASTTDFLPGGPTYTPITRDYTVEFNASCRLAGAATDEYLFEVILNFDGGRIYPLGAVGGSGGNLINVNFKTKIIQQAVGTAVPVSIRVTTPAGGQYQCRNATHPTKEFATITISPVQTRSNQNPAAS